MTWVKLDDNWCDSPQVLEAGPEAAWLYVCGLSWCARQLTDGRIPASILGRLVALPDVEAAAARLVSVGLWKPAEYGYEVVDYLEHQPSKEKVLTIRERRKEAGHAGGLRSGVTRREQREAAARSKEDEASTKQVASSRLEHPSRRDGTTSRPLGAGRRPGVDKSRGRRPDQAMAESEIDHLSPIGLQALRQQAITSLGDGLPDGWERDEGNPYESMIVGRMKKLMLQELTEAFEASRRDDRRTGTA